MPYIPKEQRKNLTKHIHDLAWEVEEIVERTPSANTAGLINFVITKLILSLLSFEPVVGYAKLNKMIGVLECCKLEIYRRLVAPYEGKKIKENGDVFR